MLIGDDDSSTIAAVQALYKIANPHKELNTNTIRYLQKCFNYALTQNTGNSTKMDASSKKNSSSRFQ